MTSSKKNRRYRIWLIAFLAINVIVTLLFGFHRVERFWIYSPRFDGIGTSNPIDRILSHWLYLFIPLLLAFIPFFWGWLKRKGLLKTIETSSKQSPQYSGILQAFGKICADNWGELLVIFISSVLVIFNFSVIVTDLSEASPSGFAASFVFLALSIFSILITVIGMFYAFLAENNSYDLLQDKALFLPTFSAFMKRIDRRLEEIYRDDLDPTRIQSHEPIQYTIKSMLLTPFIGHGGVTESDSEVLSLFNEHQKLLKQNLQSGHCSVEMITLEPKELREWYFDIQWVVALSKKGIDPNHIDPNTAQSLFEELDNAAEVSTTQRFNQDMHMNGGLLSFKTLRENLKTFIQSGSVKISQIDNIPFQMFLVKKNDERQFALLTYVGSDTYRRLVNDIKEPNEDHIAKSVGEIMNRLHSCFYTEDYRHLALLETHFDHLWSKTGVSTFLDDNKWTGILVPNNVPATKT